METEHKVISMQCDAYEPDRIAGIIKEDMEEHSQDYCRGGCPGALQEAMHLMRSQNENADMRMKKIRYTVDNVQNPLAPEPDGRVLY